MPPQSAQSLSQGARRARDDGNMVGGARRLLVALSGRANALMNVRFEGNNGHDADVTRCLLMTHSGPYGAPLLECARMSGLLL